MSRPYHGPWAVLTLDEMRELIAAARRAYPRHGDTLMPPVLGEALRKLMTATDFDPRARQPHA